MKLLLFAIMLIILIFLWPGVVHHTPGFWGSEAVTAVTLALSLMFVLLLVDLLICKHIDLPHFKSAYELCINTFDDESCQILIKLKRLESIIYHGISIAFVGLAIIDFPACLIKWLYGSKFLIVKIPLLMSAALIAFGVIIAAMVGSFVIFLIAGENTNLWLEFNHKLHLAKPNLRRRNVWLIILALTVIFTSGSYVRVNNDGIRVRASWVTAERFYDWNHIQGIIEAHEYHKIKRGAITETHHYIINFTDYSVWVSPGSDMELPLTNMSPIDSAVKFIRKMSKHPVTYRVTYDYSAIH